MSAVREAVTAGVLFLSAAFAAAALFVADKVRSVLSSTDSTTILVWMVAAGVLAVLNFAVLFWRMVRVQDDEPRVPSPPMVVVRPASSIDADIVRHKEAFEREMRSDEPPARRVVLPPIEVNVPAEEKRPVTKVLSVEELRRIKLTDEPKEEVEPDKQAYDDPYYTGGY